MLYDNAQLARVYLHAWALTGDARYRECATGTLDYMLRELRTADGAFAASQDADTEGVEGATFTWRATEIREVLGDDAALFATAYGVTDDGNWEGVTILSRVRDDAELAEAYGLTEADVAARLAAARETLLARRRERAQPARDDKALAAWNGLAIAAFADAGRAFGEPAYVAAAVRAAEAIVGGLLGPDGALGRSWKDGRATGSGVLEDYATSPTACWRCTRPRSTSAGSRRPRPRRRDPRAVRRSGRRLLRHRRRPRAARHPAEGRPGQRRPVRQRDGRRSCSCGWPR